MNSKTAKLRGIEGILKIIREKYSQS